MYLCGSGPGILVAYAFRLGVTKKRVPLARARSLVSANPNKRSVGTQNDLDHHHQSPHTTRTFAIVIWISPPFRHTLSFSALELVKRVDLCGEPKRGRNRNITAIFGRHNDYTFPHQNRFRTSHQSKLILRLDHSYDIKTFTPASRRVIKDELWVFAIVSLLSNGTDIE